jgi:predicted TIM-barrel fold metal-dependent hydrolase
MLFGSDYPLFEHALPLKNWVQLMSNLRMPDQLVDEGYPQVTAEEIERVMWKNAARLFFGERT